MMTVLVLGEGELYRSGCMSSKGWKAARSKGSRCFSTAFDEEDVDAEDEAEEADARLRESEER